MSSLALNAQALLLRELAALKRELQTYPDDASVWVLPEGMPNSAGTLVLHLCGNLQFFIGARLGGSGYVRDRPREFAARDLSRDELLAELGEAESAVRLGLSVVTDAQMASRFPDPIGEHTFETGDLVMHICSHAAYHLGQIDYHRRVVTKQNVGIDALSPREMRSAQR